MPIDNRKNLRTDSGRSISVKGITSHRGASKITILVFSLLAGALFYSVYQIAPLYYYYFELHNQMIAIIPKADILRDEEIRGRIGKVIKDLEIPADPKDLLIQRDDRKLRLKLKYQEVFYIPWRGKDIDLHYFDFVIDVTGPY